MYSNIFSVKLQQKSPQMPLVFGYQSSVVRGLTARDICVETYQTPESGIEIKTHPIHDSVYNVSTISGAAWRDYNNDGWLDLYIVNSALVRPAPDAVLPKNTL